jgi:glycosyltransferase involved in cell wall biosynthesis
MDGARKKILFISERAGFAGGIERFIFNTARLLGGAGFEVYGEFDRPDRDAENFTTAFSRVFAPDEPVDADLAVIHRIADSARLERLLERYGERLALYVHDHECYCPRTYRYTPFGRNDCRRPYALVRCGLCAMATSPRRWRGGFFPELAARTVKCRRNLELLKQIPRVAVLSEFMRGNLVMNGFDPGRVAVIPPPVPVPPELPPRPENDPPRLLFTGQLIRGKGVDQLLRALPHLHHPYRLTIAGDGNQRPELERLAVELGVADKVDFAGWVAEPEKLAAECDVAVLPFFWQEPFGLVGPEAMARELPVVAFQVGGVDEWLRDGENGFAVPPRDVVKFAAAIDGLLADKDLRLKLGNCGRAFVRERFSEDEYVRRFGAWMGRNGGVS